MDKEDTNSDGVGKDDGNCAGAGKYAPITLPDPISPAEAI